MSIVKTAKRSMTLDCDLTGVEQAKYQRILQPQGEANVHLSHTKSYTAIASSRRALSASFFAFPVTTTAPRSMA